MNLPSPGPTYDKNNEANARQILQLEDGRNLKKGGEGKFTPVLAGSVTPGSPTYTGQLGLWKLFGNIMFVQGFVGISNKGGMAGNLMVTGFPLPQITVSLSAQAELGLTRLIGLTHAAGYTQWVARMETGQAEASIREHGSAVNTVAQTVANTANATEISFAGFYFVDARG